MNFSAIALFMVIGCTIFPGTSGAEERIEHDFIETYESDPTVAMISGWLVGTTADVWYINSSHDIYDGEKKVGKGDTDGEMTGGSLFLGKGDWLVSLSFKDGDFQTNANMDDGARTRLDSDQSEFEIQLRHIYREASQKNTVYSFGGYRKIDLDNEYTISQGAFWTDTGTSVLEEELTYHALFLGVGIILPFTEHLGIRADVALNGVYGERDIKNSLPEVEDSFSGMGAGFTGHVTAYWRIYKGLNLQLGGKFDYFHTDASFDEDETEMPVYTRYGGYAMLGYMHKF